MVANRKVTGKAASMPAGIGAGIAVCFAVTAVGACIIAILLGTERFAEDAVGYGSAIILILSAVLGALTATGMIKHRRLVVCAGVGIGYFLMLVLINALCFGGQYSGMGVTALVILAGCMCVVLLGLKGEVKSKRGRRKIYTG